VENLEDKPDSQTHGTGLLEPVFRTIPPWAVASAATS